MFTASLTSVNVFDYSKDPDYRAWATIVGVVFLVVATVVTEVTGTEAMYAHGSMEIHGFLAALER